MYTVSGAAQIHGALGSSVDSAWDPQRGRGSVPMKRAWPIIAVNSVPRSSTWYMRLLDAQETHPGATVFNMVVEPDGVTLVCLHHWGPSGATGDKDWPSLSSPAAGAVGNGLLLWFVVDDFEACWDRAKGLGAAVEEEPNTNNGTGMPAFMIRDPDGHHVVVNKGS